MPILLTWSRLDESLDPQLREKLPAPVFEDSISILKEATIPQTLLLWVLVTFLLGLLVEWLLEIFFLRKGRVNLSKLQAKTIYIENRLAAALMYVTQIVIAPDPLSD